MTDEEAAGVATDDDTAVAALADDAYVGPLVDAHGPVELEPAEDPFRRLVVSILRQQVSTDAAAAIRERLFEQVEVTPAGLLDADPATMRDAGVSAAKTEYLRALAERWRAEGYSRGYFAEVDDETVAAELQEIRGVGPWTTDMFLMFGLGRPDVFPVGDLGIRKEMQQLFEDDLTRAEMRDRAERWAPYRSYASLYLWRATD